MQLLERAALWANETFTKYIVTVAANARNCSVFYGDF